MQQHRSGDKTSDTVFQVWHLQVADLILRCLQREPFKRPTAKEAFEILQNLAACNKFHTNLPQSLRSPTHSAPTGPVLCHPISRLPSHSSSQISQRVATAIPSVWSVVSRLHLKRMLMLTWTESHPLPFIEVHPPVRKACHQEISQSKPNEVPIGIIQLSGILECKALLLSV